MPYDLGALRCFRIDADLGKIQFLDSTYLLASSSFPIQAGVHDCFQIAIQIADLDYRYRSSIRSKAFSSISSVSYFPEAIASRI